MPHDVIARVNQIGHSQGQPSILTFQDRHGNPIGEDDPDFSTPDKIKGVPDTEINAPPMDVPDNSVNPVSATTNTTDDDDINIAEPETENNIITNETVDNEIAPPRRSNRVRNPVKIYKPSFTGKSMLHPQLPLATRSPLSTPTLICLRITEWIGITSCT